MPHRPIRHALTALALAGGIASAAAAPSAGDLASRYSAGKSRAGALRSQIASRAAGSGGPTGIT